MEQEDCFLAHTMGKKWCQIWTTGLDTGQHQPVQRKQRVEIKVKPGRDDIPKRSRPTWTAANPGQQDKDPTNNCQNALALVQCNYTFFKAILRRHASAERHRYSPLCT